MVPLGCRLPEDMQGSPFSENLLYSEAVKKKTVLIDLPFQGYGIWVYRVASGDEAGRLIVRRRLCVRLETDKEKEDWTKFSPEPPRQDVELVGGLRLLVQEWKELTEDLPHLEKWGNDSADKPKIRFVDEITNGCRLPFSQTTLDLMIHEFGLPPSYIHDLVGDYAVPLCLKWVTYSAPCVPEVDPGPSRTNLAFVLQSPKYDDLPGFANFISTALSWDPKTNVTSGFLGYIPQPEQDTFNMVLDEILQPRNGNLAGNPMMIPTLILKACCESYRTRLELAREVLDVSQRMSERFLGLVQALKKSGYKQDKAYKEMKDGIYPANHKRDYERSLSNEAFSFSKDLGTSCNYALVKVSSLAKKLRSNAKAKTTEPIAGKELESLVLHLENKLDAYDHRRQRILDRMRTNFEQREHDIQSLLSILTANSSQAAEKDNAQMRKISFLSMLFLPATAIATIFGMVQFFTVQDGKMSVSPSIIVYWEFTLPITVAVFIGWYAVNKFHAGMEKCPGKSPSDNNSGSEIVRQDSQSSTTTGTSTREYNSLMTKDEETTSEAEKRSGRLKITRNPWHFGPTSDVISKEEPQRNWGHDENV